ncbi:MAG: creatininase family protein [Armatimonadota bacterium]|nr:MAG: creatininase family protein [Armatimonadota bacterium]
MVNWENSFHEIERAKPEIAILPIGAIEQHSYHLPLATDYLAAQALAERVADELDNCYLLPALPFSCSREHGDFFGTVWLRPATLAAVIQDLVGALHHHGISKVALLVAHGGNWIVKPTVREIDLDRKGAHVIFTTPDAFTVEQGEFADLHAGRGETSLIMHLRPDLVKMDKVKPDFSPAQGREFFDYTGIGAVSPTGLWGAPSGASPEEGERNLKEAAQRAAAYIKQTFAEIDRLEAERGPRRN